MCPSVPCYWLFYSSGRKEKCNKHGGLKKSTHSSTDKRPPPFLHPRFPCNLGWSHSGEVTDSIAAAACASTVACPALRQQTPTCSLNCTAAWKILSPKGQECKQRVDTQLTRPTRSSGSRKTTRFSTIYPLSNEWCHNFLQLCSLKVKKQTKKKVWPHMLVSSSEGALGSKKYCMALTFAWLLLWRSNIYSNLD